MFFHFFPMIENILIYYHLGKDMLHSYKKAVFVGNIVSLYELWTHYFLAMIQRTFRVERLGLWGRHTRRTLLNGH